MIYSAAVVGGVCPDRYSMYPAQQRCRYPILMRAYYCSQLRFKQLCVKFFKRGIYCLVQTLLHNDLKPAWEHFNQLELELLHNLNPYVQLKSEDNASSVGKKLLAGWKEYYGDYNSPEMKQVLKAVQRETNKILKNRK